MNLAALDAAITYFQSVGMHNVRTRDYEGRRELDPQCEPDYVPEWRVICDTCYHTKHVQGSRPVTCPACGEDELDALTITEVPA